MALIAVSKADDVLRACGDLSFTRELDHCATPNQNARATFVAGWEWRTNALEVFGDRLGLIPIFYSAQGSTIYLSDSLMQIVAALPSAEWDLDALAVFLRLGFFIADDTPFKDVKILPRGSRAMITAERFAFPAYVAPRTRTELAVSRTRACDQYEELFRDAVRSRCLDGRIGLPLSGGRDSRHILFELTKLARRPDIAVTFSPDPVRRQEIEIAEQLCASFDIPHVAIVGDGRFAVEKVLEKHRKTHYLTDEHTWYLEVSASLKAQGVDLIFDGIGGDVLSNGLFYDKLLMRSFEGSDAHKTAEILLGNRRSMPHLSETWETCFSWERARERLARETTLHIGQPNPVASFYFWNRTCREIALAPVCLGAEFRVAMPYLSPDLLEFLLALPGRDFGAPGFHDEVIERAFAEFAQIPFRSIKQAGRTPRVRTTWSDSLAYISCCWAGSRAKLVRRRFVATRAVRVVALQDVTRDEWWLQQLIYLLGLDFPIRSKQPAGLSPDVTETN